MHIIPKSEEVENALLRGINTCIYTRFIADCDTPVSLMHKITRSEDICFLLESVTGGAIKGRYSMIGLAPDVIWRSLGDTSEINRNARHDKSAFEVQNLKPLDALRDLIAESQMELPRDLPQSSAGLFGYLGYDMIRHIEHLPNINPDPIGMQDAIMMRPSLILVVDGVKGEIVIVAPIWADVKNKTNNQKEIGEKYQYAYSQIEEIIERLKSPAPAPLIEPPLDMADIEMVSNISKQNYLDIVAKAKEYICAGDIFQVVPSQRWSGRFEHPPFALYRALRRTNPSPYMFFFNFGEAQIIGASPEILVKTQDGKVTIRPIAGTRPRGTTEAEDGALEEELLNDPKELAEHLMLLDLGRNDVGRVAKIGTVTPTEQFTIERYSHVMHIVSNVEGELSDNYDALSALIAGLPAGTLSGAPKIRAMEIIDEVEPEKRGVYGGGVGYFSANGNMDMCIALRTAILKDKTLYIQAGGGVVYDSDPEAEFQETVHKSNALKRAAKDAAAFARYEN